jgi:hypothetical protein
MTVKPLRISNPPPIAEQLADPPVRNLKDPHGRPAAPEADRKKQGARLAIARQRFYKTASLAARALGIAGPTYLAHENGTRQIRGDIGLFYADQFNVSVDWILHNKGSGPEHDPSEGGAPDPTVRSSAETSDAGLAALLNELNVSRGPLNSFVRRDPDSSEPGRLPPASQTDGWLAELGPASGHPNECTVALSEDDDGITLALRDIFRIPLTALERPRLFAVRLPMAADLLAGQYVFVDPDQTHIDDESMFLVMRALGPPTPACIMRSERTGQPQIGRPGGKPPVDLAESGMRIVGQIVMHLKPLANSEVREIVGNMFKAR